MRLLDLFCGAGGGAVGYHRAGFTEIVGVDIRPQKNYPFTFVLGDALEYVAEHGGEFDVIHASPPCQAYSAGARMRQGIAKAHPKLIEPTRHLLVTSGKAFVMENVPGAPLFTALGFCGSAFGLLVRRHRRFESNQMLLAPPCRHDLQPDVIAVYGDHPGDGVVRKGHPARRAKDVAQAQEALGIDWITTWAELKEAIPPAYTECIGRQLVTLGPAEGAEEGKG